MDREPSESSCEFRHDGRRLQSATRRVLVGASAMALPMGTFEHEEVVPGYYAAPIHSLDEGADSSCGNFTVLWLFPFRLGWFLLIAALHYFFLIAGDAIVRGAVADRALAVIAWKVIYVGLRGLITGWLLASWVCLFRQCETRRANQERWIQSEIQY